MVSDFQPQESYQFFLQEVPDLLLSLEQGLLSLKEQRERQKIHDLMRIAHSLKGGAACVGMNHIQSIAHELESVFKILKETDLEISLELESLLLQAYDCLSKPLFEEISTGYCNRTESLERGRILFSHLNQHLQSLTNLTVISEEESWWREEIEQGLDRLEKILANPNAQAVQSDLQASCKIFQEVAELAGLEEIVNLVKNSQQLLQKHPELAYSIGAATLEKLRTKLIKINPNSITKSTEEVAEREPIASLNTALPAALGVRLDVEKLELLNSLVGDLVTQDNRFLIQNQQYEETLETLVQWFGRFKLFLRELSSKAGQQRLSGKEDTETVLHRQRYLQKYLQNGLLGCTEELVQLEEMIQDFTLLGTVFGQLLKQRQKTLKQVQGNLIEARMVTAGQLLNQFPRMIRDLCAKENKLVKLELNGSHTLIDKAILDKLYDPLVHLIRNAFDHGCETAAERKELGKSEAGSIAISVYHRGDQTLITVSDDGRGIAVDKIRQRIVNLGWLSPQSATMLSTESLYEYLFRSGFSTSEKISELSGRGMGLSAVKLQVESLKGSIEVSSQWGVGTTFTLRLPLTLTITKLLVFRLGALLLAIPITSLVSIVVADSKDIETQHGKDYYLAMGRRVPLYPTNWLTTYNYPLASNAAPTIPGQEWHKSEKITLLLIARGEDRIALKIDRIVRSQDLVIKPFNELIIPPATLSGCTLLGDGRLVPVLDGAALVEKWRRHYEAEKAYSLVPSSQQISLPLIQIVDDSLTIRQTLAASLRKAGYQVVQARDGWEALGQLQQNLDIRAIICDIEMPRMNGLELLSRLRGDSRNLSLVDKRIPVIVLTSRSGEKHRQLARRMGADSYIVKPYVERELLDNLETLLVKT